MSEAFRKLSLRPIWSRGVRAIKVFHSDFIDLLQKFGRATLIVTMAVCAFPDVSFAKTIRLKSDSAWHIAKEGEDIALGVKAIVSTEDMSALAGSVKFACSAAEQTVTLSLTLPLALVSRFEASESLVANFDSETPVRIPIEALAGPSGVSLNALAGEASLAGLEALLMAIRNYTDIQFTVGSTDFVFKVSNESDSINTDLKKAAVDEFSASCKYLAR